MSLDEATEQIIENDRHAGHAWTTVMMALQYTYKEGSVNDGWRRLRRVRGDGVPRWLVQRWADEAGLIDHS